MKGLFARKIIDWILPVSFSVIILVIGILNFKLFYHQVKDGKVDSEAIERTYKSEFHMKDSFADLYGLSLNILNKKIVGNFEYVKDNSGFMHSIASASCSDEAAEQFLEDMIILRDELEQREIPMVYVQIPSRELEGYSDYPSEVFGQTARVIERLIKKLDDSGIEILNIGEHCLNDEDSMNVGQFFFKTDIHLTTDAEMWVGKYVADYLNDNTACEINEDIFDVNQYKKESHRFRGNLVKESGCFFSKDDVFDVYYPNYETSMVLDNWLQGIKKEGEFADVLMNGGFRTYWVLNYLQWGSPYYKIINNNQDRNNILMIMDSMCMRMVSYLSIDCHKVTVLDPRYFNGINLINLALENEVYDAVVVCHTSTLFGQSLFPEQVELDKLYEMDSVEGVDMCSIDYCNGIWTENKKTINVDTAQSYIELSGWAADLQEGLTAGNVYIAIGSHVIKCEYGIESQSLREFFCNENFSKCGFRVKIPTELFVKEKNENLQFWVISADGKVVYKSLDYMVNVENG